MNESISIKNEASLDDSIFPSGDANQAYIAFMADFLRLDNDEFVDALFGIFGVEFNEIEPNETKSRLDKCELSKAELMFDLLDGKAVSRNRNLLDLMLKQVDDQTGKQLMTFGAGDSMNANKSIVEENMIVSSKMLGVKKILPNDFLEFFDETWFRRVYDKGEITRKDIIHDFIFNSIKNSWYPCFLTEEKKSNILERFSSHKIVFDYVNSLPAIDDRSPLYVKYKIRGSELFIDDWYRSKYKDIDGIDDCLMHYILYGENEGRQPNPYFSPQWYMKENDISGWGSLLLHYVEVGHRIGLRPSIRFDASIYLKLTRNEVSRSGGYENIALTRYLKYGAQWIGEKCYSIENPDFKVELGASNIGSIYESRSLFGHNLRIVLGSSNDDEREENENIKIDSYGQYFDPNELKITWVIPDFEKGGGGHTTIFRMIKLLSMKGHRQNVIIYDRASGRDGRAARDVIFRDFFVSNIEVVYYDELNKESFELQDAVVATSFETVSYAFGVKGKKYFYLVQDYEPYFHPAGSLSLVAERTYSRDIDCLCASPWLKKKMEEHGRWAESFRLGVDESIYKQNADGAKEKKGNSIPRIVLYGRSFTARRCVELAIAALIQLAKKNVEFHVDIIHGDSIPEDIVLPFSNVRYPTLTPERLAELYRNGSIGVVFSATNYSLLPQEMMACGLEVVDVVSESTVETYPEGVVHLVQPEPVLISEKLNELINRDVPHSLNKSREEWLKYSWDDACNTINRAMIARLENAGYVPKMNLRKNKINTQSKIKASVVIPVFNGMRDLPILLGRLKAQIAPWDTEIIAIDSSSDDGSYEYLRSQQGVSVHKIPKEDFGHGKTRNLGCQMARGEYVAFITQDAYPVGKFWLYDLVTSLEAHPDAAGAFGRHVAHKNANPFTKRDIDQFFNMFYHGPQCISIGVNWNRYGIDQGRISEYLRYYSDNNSCLKREIWEVVPYPDIDYGEDQVWAQKICEMGLSKLYVHQAVVEHSHDYDASETFKRARIEAEFFSRYFGIEVVEYNFPDASSRKLINAINDADKKWALENACAADEVNLRCQVNESRILGYVEGVKNARERDLI